MADVLDIPGMPKTTGWDFNGSGSLSPLVADSGTKITEMANAINWGPSFNNVANIAPTDFGALTNGSFSQSMHDAMGNFSKSLDNGFETLKNGMGATEIANLLGGLGAVGGGVQKFGVKLISKTSGEIVFFRVMPTISESRAAQYDDVMMPHHPGLIAKYNHTAPRSWSIGNIKLISRTIAEADENQKIINTIRGWLMPYYGSGTEMTTPDMLGAPPDLLEFTAYGQHNIGGIPVVLENASWDWPNDVDWIHTSNGEPFPVIMNLGQLQLKEAWSPREYSGFDLAAYKQGDMIGAYVPAVIPPLEVSKPETSTSGNTTTDTSQSGISSNEPSTATAGEKVVTSATPQPKDLGGAQPVPKGAPIPTIAAAKEWGAQPWKPFVPSNPSKQSIMHDSASNLGMQNSGVSKFGLF